MDKRQFATSYQSPLGELLISSDGIALTGLWFRNQKFFGGKYKDFINNDSLKIFAETNLWLDRYFNGQQPEISELKLAPAGSGFQHKVWDELMKIPYGNVVTYGDIAKQLGINSSQAIGQAVGHNPISIIVPCHRVIGRNKQMTGYAGGIERKQWLLQHEGIIL